MAVKSTKNDASKLFVKNCLLFIFFLNHFYIICFTEIYGR